MGCGCFGGTAEEAWRNVPEMKLVERLADESHFGVSIVGCSCGTRYLKVFCERIDWKDGNDPQQVVVTAISAEEELALQGLDEVALESAISRLSPRRCLEAHYPSDGPQSIGWTGAISLMRHD
jgi:hypothetical protein